MIAIILNSGLGKRMAALTENRHKSLVQLSDGQTLFGRQLRLLYDAGVRNFLVTTGPYEEQLKDIARVTLPSGCAVTFVNNPDYATTNYIYSLYLARNELHDDVLLLHGDLVFDRLLARDVLASPLPRLVTVDMHKPLPEKDFKARLAQGLVREVSIHTFGADCVALQPFYKLDRALMDAWMERIALFVARGETGCYAENALNELLDAAQLEPFDCTGHFIEEIDTPEDYAAVCEGIRRMDFDTQPRFVQSGAMNEIPALLQRFRVQKPMLVCGRSYDLLPVQPILEGAGVRAVRFSAFSANPKYEEVAAGVRLFNAEGCDGLLSVGGGSAMDVAKCVKLFAPLDVNVNYLEQKPRYSPVAHIAVPTTAGSGSEATRYAVIYHHGDKQSVAHDSIFPDAAVLDVTLLETLSPYQRKAGFMDAFCHSVEAMWSVHADSASRAHAANALQALREAFEGYFAAALHSDQVLWAAHEAGLAINLSQTTAAHAMCYKLTSLYGLAHGHAAAMCLPGVWALLLNAADHGQASPQTVEALWGIATAMGVPTPREAYRWFCAMTHTLALTMPFAHYEAKDLAALVASVNPTRLQNFPYTMTRAEIETAYLQALDIPTV